jgi:uncharacterized protein
MLHPRRVRRFNVRVPLRDGITLAADLVLPDALPAPVVVMRTPYGRGGESQTKRADAFATAGYCACWVDVRGRGDSEGAIDPYRNDGLDGVDVIAWAASQDWCDGSVATYGGSYAGRVSTSALDADVTAKLIDLHPNGFAERLCDGLVRLR